MPATTELASPVHAMIGERVLVREIGVSSTTAGGIVLPESAKEKPYRGRVLAVGPKVSSVKLNDVVVWPRYSGSEVTLDGESYIVVTESELYCIEKRGS